MEEKQTPQQQPKTAPESDTQRISFVAILFFVLCIAAAVTLLTAAAVMWLAELLDSVALSALIFSGAAAIVALIIYLGSVRRSVRIIHDWFGTVYETSRIAKSGYEKVKSWITLIFG